MNKKQPRKSVTIRVGNHELNPAKVHLSQKPSKMVFSNVNRNFFLCGMSGVDLEILVVN